MRASGGPLGVDAVGPLWVNGGRETAGAQTLSAWPGIGPFLALAQPSNAGLTCLLNYFPPSNACDAHGVQDRLWNPALMDGGKLMAAAVKMVRRTYLETSGSAGGGGGAAADESSMMDEMARGLGVSTVPTMDLHEGSRSDELPALQKADVARVMVALGQARRRWPADGAPGAGAGSDHTASDSAEEDGDSDGTGDLDDMLAALRARHSAFLERHSERADRY